MVCAGEGAGWVARRAVQGHPTRGCKLLVTLVSLCICALEMASSHLTGIRACPGLRPSRVSTCLARVHTRVCMQACQQPGGSAILRRARCAGKPALFPTGFHDNCLWPQAVTLCPRAAPSPGPRPRPPLPGVTSPSTCTAWGTGAVFRKGAREGRVGCPTGGLRLGAAGGGWLIEVVIACSRPC